MFGNLCKYTLTFVIALCCCDEYQKNCMIASNTVRVVCYSFLGINLVQCADKVTLDELRSFS